MARILVTRYGFYPSRGVRGFPYLAARLYVREQVAGERFRARATGIEPGIGWVIRWGNRKRLVPGLNVQLSYALDAFTAGREGLTVLVQLGLGIRRSRIDQPRAKAPD